MRDSRRGDGGGERALSLETRERFRRVLVVDDNPINRRVALALLAALGLSGIEAEDGAVALELAHSGCFDLVLMDCMMPGMDGFEVTRRMRLTEAGRSGPPVVALSAHVTHANRERCFDSGMVAFLAKPFRMQSLAACLESLVESGH